MSGVYRVYNEVTRLRENKKPLVKTRGVCTPMMHMRKIVIHPL
ncbi:MAG: hypothetical protein K0Q66_1229 [Chitinophagaceae bacterium]|jgi:hypothetical protein|nr:hypothetical protein [Chitinophagaceae bacterium]